MRRFSLYLLIVLVPLLGTSLVSSSAAPVVAWEKEAWDADETPFRQAEQEVLRSLNTKEVGRMRRVYARLEQQAQARPSDTMAQFKQAVALSRLLLRGVQELPNTDRFRERLGQLSPRSYVFARTRYLVEREHNNFSPDVRKVGRRLLERAPDDYHVLYYQARALDTRIPTERQESFAHAQRILQLRPKDYKSYYLLGDRYRDVWFDSNLDNSAPRGSRWSGTKDKTNRDRAIYYFREAQKRLPSDAPFRASLEKAIAVMLAGRIL